MVKCEICHFDNPAGFAYCGRCGNGLAVDVPDDSFVSSAIEGERKQVTVLFADISGFTALNDAAESPAQVERVLQVVNRCLDMLSDVVYEYDGYVDKYMGDAIMAVFGAPRSHEDDPERALHAALAMQERLEAFNRNPPAPLVEPLGIHIGINTGVVIAGLVGTRRKRGYTVMGDAVNVASRLEGVSERGEILVSQDTYYLTQQLFNFKSRQPVTVKGKRQPLIVYRLQGVKQQRHKRGIAGLRAPMVGRKAQFSALQQQMAALQNGIGGITVVAGEAGLGKSRLVSEIQQQISPDTDLLWLEGRGLSYRQNQSYRLIIEILRAYLHAGPETPTDVVWKNLQAVGDDLFGERADVVLPYLGVLIGAKLDEKTAQSLPADTPALQQRVFESVGEWVEAVAARQPLVLVFEDLHWADTSSVQLLEYLLDLTRKLPLRIICITRPEKDSLFWQVKERAAETYPAQYTEILLEPLTPPQSRSLVDRLLHVEDLPDELEDLILNRAEGNPLFVEEVLRSLIEDETIVQQNGHWVVARPVVDIDIPETLTGVLTARIDRLDEREKRLLQIASVIGRVFSRSVLKAVAEDVTTDPAELEEMLDDLVDAELIHERMDTGEREYIFKHVLTYETAYNTLLIHQRRIYHKRIADNMAPLYYLRGEEYASIVAHHYAQGEVWDRALTYQIRAAEAAKATFDNKNAIDFYTEALSTALLVDDLEPDILPKIHEGRGNILKRMGRVDDARADFEQALALAKANQNLPIQMRVLAELGNIYAGYHKFSHAEPYFEQALNLARKSDDKLGLVDTLNQLGEFKFNMGQLADASAYFHEALETAQSLRNTPRITAGKDGLAAVILYQGEVNAAVERLEAVAGTWRDIGNYQGLMKTYGWLATAYHWLADYRRSDQICRDAAELQKRTGDLNWAPTFSYRSAQNALVQGNLSLAADRFTETTVISTQLTNSVWQAMGLLGTAEYYFALGDISAGEIAVEQAIALAESTGSPVWASRARRMAGVARRMRGDFAKAESILQAEFDEMHRLGFAADQVEIFTELLSAQMAAGEWEKVERQITRLIALIVPSSMRAYHARTFCISAELATRNRQFEHAVTLLLQGRDIAQNARHILLEIEIELTMIAPLLGLNRVPQAQESFSRAETLMQRVAHTAPDALRQKQFLTKSPLAQRLKQIARQLNR